MIAIFFPAHFLCSFCRKGGHRSSDCRYSWDSPIIHDAPKDESVPVKFKDRPDGELSEASFKTRSEDSLQ